MDKELQQALAAIITKTTSAVDNGVTFLSQQLPEVIQQLLMWKMIESLFWFVVFWVMSIILLFVARWVFKHEDVDEIWGVGFVAGAGSVATALIALHNDTWLMILVAPKVYLIQYAAWLVK